MTEKVRKKVETWGSDKLVIIAGFSKRWDHNLFSTHHPSSEKARVIGRDRGRG